MTLATIAIANAKAFEAKKTGFGQAQDGWSLTLRIQDEDIPPHVRDAKKGTRYMVALVEIGDNEEPVQRPVVSQTAAVRPRPVSRSSAGADGERRKFGEMLPAQQAGMLCQDQAFRKFLGEFAVGKIAGLAYGSILNGEETAHIVRTLCKVGSRAEIQPDNAEWSSLVLAYRLWQREPEFVG